MYFGYNADGAVSSEPAFRWVIEGNYNTGTERDLEAYWEYVDTAANVWRPIFVYRNKATTTTGGETLVLNNEYLYLQGTRAAPLTFTLKPKNSNQPAQIWVQGLGTGNNTNQFLKIAGGSSDSNAAFIRLGGNTCTTGEMGGGNYAEGLLQLGAGAPSTHTAGTTAGTIVMLAGATPTEYFRLQYDGKVVLNNPTVAASYQLDVNGSIGGGQISADVLAAGGFRFKGHTTKGMYLQTTNLGAGSNVLVLQSANGIDVGIGGGQIRVKSSVGFGFASGGPDDSVGDTLLYRDAAGTLAQRNGANAQTLRVYRGWTDGSNSSRVEIGWNSTTALFNTVGIGTGSKGNVAFGTAALATSATVGYIMVPGCAGTATGVPADIPTGQYPVVYDTTNKKIGVYDGGWIWTAALT
ncbi:MAG: hypothetical protein IPJ61_18240 [Tessaracoccus sp.]|uniref:hypothetical protein n=1 Tax=Tessaracoccus sp. TaxID=1971211 RepID=UPI001EC29D37|nr:hypothetical protein [Tessaracoccus sp.]MBK7822924.1 hypothetical protein [Tessaracoccus sp.]